MIDCFTRKLTRREATGTLLSAGAFICASGGVSAQTARPFATEVVDIHHHFLPPDYKTLAKPWLDRFAVGASEVLLWTPERSLAAMEAARVGHAVLSISSPGAYFGNGGSARATARSCNDYAVRLAEQHQGRFSFFTTLPMPDVAGAIAEADRAAELPGCRGIGLMTNYDGRYLGDPMFRKLFEHLATRDTLIFVHPTSAPCCAGLVPELPTPTIEFPVDTARTIGSLLWSGTLSAFPRLRFVFCHGGGVVPMLLERLGSFAASRPDLQKRVPEGYQVALSRLLVDTASVTTPPALAALRAWLPPENILFGTDYPWGQPARARTRLEQLGLPVEQLAAIERGNALALLKAPRLLG